MTEKGKFETTEGIFVGKELAGSGEKNGKKWTRYKIKFKPRMDAETGFSFTVFTPLKAKKTFQLDELKEGEEYKVLFVAEERTNNQGQEYTSKTAIGVYEPGKNGDDTAQSSGGSSAGIDLTGFDQFAEKYKVLLKEKKVEPNAVHMAGSFLASTEKERTAALIDRCKEALK